MIFYPSFNSSPRADRIQSNSKSNEPWERYLAYMVTHLPKVNIKIFYSICCVRQSILPTSFTDDQGRGLGEVNPPPQTHGRPEILHVAAEKDAS